MGPIPVTVRYRFGEGGGSRDASFRGLLFDRSEAAVLRRLEEAHRFAEWVEVVEVRWRGGSADSVSPGDGRGCIPSHASEGCIRRAGMETMTIVRAGGGDGAPGGAAWRPRRHARSTMFKPAHLVTDDAVLDCVLLDLSPGGAQVCLMAGAEPPDRAVLWLPMGESRPVRRAWQQGSLVGFEAVGDTSQPS